MNGKTANDPATAGGPDCGARKLAATLAATLVLTAALGLAQSVDLQPAPRDALFQVPLMDADVQPAPRVHAEAPATAASAAAPSRARSQTPSAGAVAESEALPPGAFGLQVRALEAASWPDDAAPLDAAAKQRHKPVAAKGGESARELGAGQRDQVAQNALPAPVGKAARADRAKDELARAAPGRGQPATAREAAQRFLAEQERLAGVRLQPATGYWANTYVPGDPVMRLLEARLQRWDRTALGASIGDARLEASVGQNRQPFDLPRNAALAAYLHADKAAVHGRSRLRIQVGLQASRKRGGLRPDMNVGVVLDMRRPLDAATGARLRALVMALVGARQPGDRFSITVAGHPGGLMVAPEDFRHGPVRVAMQALFADAARARGQAMDLLAALHRASQTVRRDDDASAPLGASLVLLVSTSSMAEQRESLERMAHENALAGIALSVVAVGGGADLASIDGLVLLGQGHRRVLASAENAVMLVDRELHAASRAVARALRLRIRLAPGVELVQVLGSDNLSARAAQRERALEGSIDRRMARNIGIRADRGADEEGIQILIPSFYAGDNHTVLLDVLVPGPGPVADVSVRYKDLVYRRNGIARVRLALDDGLRARGPLEHNVLKNHLAQVLADSASTAARQLGSGDGRAALVTLTAARDLIAGMRELIQGWEHDHELDNDVALLNRYLTALHTRFVHVDEHRRQLADSLRYLAFRRLTPPLQ